MLRGLFGRYVHGELTRYSHRNTMVSNITRKVNDRMTDPRDWIHRTRPYVEKWVSTHPLVLREGLKSPLVAKHLHSITNVPILDPAAVLSKDVKRALPRRIHDRDPAHRLHTFSEFIMYGIEQNGDFPFGAKMWREAMEP